MNYQHTIAQSTQAVGVGLHSGQRVHIRLLPAPDDTGIVFRRMDLNPPVEIKAQADMVRDTRLASTLVNQDGVSVQTVEHLLSACSGLEIDNLYVEIDNAELPILDGSASGFMLLLESAGLKKQNSARQYIKVLKGVRVEEGKGESSKYAALSPADEFCLSFHIEFDHPVVESTPQQLTTVVRKDGFADQIALARTFCFTRDVEAMNSAGLALGGGLDNAIVLGDYKMLNEGGLRYQDEFVKHKMLDAIGDLYLAGAPILGKYEAFRSGHALNNQLLRALFADPSSYARVTRLE